MHRPSTSAATGRALRSLIALAALGLHASAQEPGGGPPVTWAEDVAPILHRRCASCHRPGQAAPFPLLTYHDAAKRGRLLARVTTTRYMPPWRAVEGHGTFKGAMRLSDEEIETIGRWVERGAPLGDPELVPEPPSFSTEWWLGEPDMVVRMREGFQVPADGPDVYRNFVIPLELEEDRWLTAIAVRPSAPSVLHHIIFRTDTTGAALAADGQDGVPGYDGMGVGKRGTEEDRVPVRDAYLESWAVGGVPRELPGGLGHRLRKGTDLILASHFHPLGKAEVEQTTIGLYFADEPPQRMVTEVQMPPKFGFSAGLDIPAGEAHFELRDTMYLPVDVEALTVNAHAHYLGREMELVMTRPGEAPESIFLIDDWDFTWQQTYHYAQVIDMPAGTRLDARIRYDNSAGNPDNPYDPPRRVRWGLYSTDEMGGIQLLVSPKRPRDNVELLATLRLRAKRSLTEYQHPGVDMVAYMRSMDADGDGALRGAELEGPHRSLANQQDTNHDGVLDAEELAAFVRRMRFQDSGRLEGPEGGDAPRR